MSKPIIITSEDFSSNFRQCVASNLVNWPKMVHLTANSFSKLFVIKRAPMNHSTSF